MQKSEHNHMLYSVLYYYYIVFETFDYLFYIINENKLILSKK